LQTITIGASDPIRILKLHRPEALVPMMMARDLNENLQKQGKGRTIMETKPSEPYVCEIKPGDPNSPIADIVPIAPNVDGEAIPIDPKQPRADIIPTEPNIDKFVATGKRTISDPWPPVGTMSDIPPGPWTSVAGGYPPGPYWMAEGFPPRPYGPAAEGIPPGPYRAEIMPPGPAICSDQYPPDPLFCDIQPIHPAVSNEVPPYPAQVIAA
jgi:hypothetical protein